MSTATFGATEPREDFPIDSFRYLEAKLQAVRKVVMGYAAKLAATASPPDSPVYTVRREHVDEALSELLHDPERCREVVGLSD